MGRCENAASGPGERVAPSGILRGYHRVLGFSLGGAAADGMRSCAAVWYDRSRAPVGCVWRRCFAMRAARSPSLSPASGEMAGLSYPSLPSAMADARCRCRRRGRDASLVRESVRGVRVCVGRRHSGAALRARPVAVQRGTLNPSTTPHRLGRVRNARARAAPAATRSTTKNLPQQPLPPPPQPPFPPSYLWFVVWAAETGAIQS